MRVPAKVNLALSVGPRRPDGYHDLETVFCALSLVDEVTVSGGAAAPGEPVAVEVSGEGAVDVPRDGTNLAVRAALLLAERTGRRPPAAVRLAKGIPVAGGMAGGSADAAATLLACDALWGTGLPAAALAEAGAALGSDVPFPLLGGLALGRGRGELLTRLLGAPTTYSWVLALADGGLSTPAVFAELDRQRAAAAVPSLATSVEPVVAALRAGDPERLGRALVNDLQPAAVALRPALARVLAAGPALGALGAVVSGSGPTVAFLARDPRAAGDLAAALEAEGLCRAARTATGPVPGAAVVAPAGARAAGGGS